MATHCVFIAEMADENAPLTVGAMRAILQPLLERMVSIDDRQARLEWSMSQPSSPVRMTGTPGAAGMPTKLRAFVASSSAPVKFVVGQRIEVEYKVPTVKLGE